MMEHLMFNIYRCFLGFFNKSSNLKPPSITGQNQDSEWNPGKSCLSRVITHKNELQAKMKSKNKSKQTKEKGQGKWLGYIWFETILFRPSAFYLAKCLVVDNIKQNQIKIKFST